MKRLREFHNIVIDGIALKLPKWQTEPYTENILRQLQGETKVLLQGSVCRRASNDHNVPDLTNIANYEECIATEDIYISACNKPKSNWNKCYNETRDVEEELSKMFQNDLDKETSTPATKKPHKSKKRQVLIKLFGSPLDDIGREKKAPVEKLNERRSSLPVSIDINQILPPSKVTQKRKSETDAHISPRKVQKVELSNSSITEIDVPYERVPSLVVPPVFKEAANVLYYENELEIAVIGSKPSVEKSTIVKNVMQSPFIDLTEDGYDPVKVPVPTPKRLIKTDQETKAYRFSEEANVPVVHTVPGPFSPAEPTQAEAILPKSLQRPPVMSKIPISNVTITRKQSTPLNQTRNVYSTYNTSLMKNVLPGTQNALHQRNIEVSQSQASERTSKQIQPIVERYQFKPQSGGQITVQQPTNVSQNSSCPILKTLVWNKQPIPALEKLVNQQSTLPVLNNHQQWSSTNLQTHQTQNMNVNQVTNQYLPQLLRVLQSNPRVLEYELISNTACAEKIFPYAYRLVEWRMHVLSYHEKTKTFGISCEKESEAKLYEYCQQFTEMYGVNMIKNLANVDVENFGFFNILSILSKAFATYKITVGIYRVCNLLNLMVTPARTHCSSPFLQKFYNAVKLTLARLEERSTKVPLFTDTQLNCLKLQIQEYWRIQNWLKSNVLTTPRTRRRFKNTNTQPSINIVQNTVLRTANVNPSRPTPVQVNNAQSILEASGLPMNVIHVVPPSQLSDKVAFDRQSTQRILNVQPQLPSYESHIQSNPTITPRSQAPTFSSMQKVPQPEIPKSTTVEPIVSNHTVLNGISGSVEQQTLATKTVISNQISSVIDNNVSEESETNAIKSEDCDVQDKEILVDSETEITSTVKLDVKVFPSSGDVIDLTWIDDVDEVEILEEVIESKSFPFKSEEDWVEKEGEEEKNDSNREVISPSDSGVGSPSQMCQNDGYKCLCGNTATYVCACNSSMYCSRDCQEKDWIDHQRLCQRILT